MPDDAVQVDGLRDLPAAGDRPADAIVVGGGPAGLTAALYLARFRRSVVLIDAGQGRIAKIPRSHNYPGFVDGIPGGTLLDTLRRQLRRYPVRVVHAAVERVERIERLGEAAGFRVEWPGGQATGRQLLLATGVTDIAPAMPHVREALETGALRYCPVCDAYEAIGCAVGVYADGPAGVGEAVYLRHFSGDITLFMEEGDAALSDDDRRRLTRAGVRWSRAPVDSIRREGARVVVQHGAERSVCDTLYCALGLQVHSGLAQALGAALDDTGYVEVDAHYATGVPGLYAAGDVAQGLNQIAVAAGGAAIAASAMHRALGPHY
ncbi:NAD(P)/FAD-dependent oxidoreductase [Paracidovorax valerianellae]|uniref:Thioredoxin reductase (NADPH) n=1 Tax=Paracidovorax valerianellae TaxID=187868 RepID=A0A1G6YPE4_9BURK|nr:NAD(P)/FAD-dependent oxidoreductase [Paracidovorax valerianellae]MDA8447384.1 NAD(P)/FAD-dependent oxidoreductase [Paracidovorax valerianellae]SDD91883.1 thioredoxin reductase (NADPH) [Paracidovorax valerianellae]